jgi:uncharacterized protein involved in response to NO
MPDETSLRPAHDVFHRSFVWVALIMGLGVGFLLGAALALSMAFGFPLGGGFASLIQAHGHVQLMGWACLFIMGVSLYFLPRLSGIPLAQPQWPKWILALMTVGLMLRGLGHTLLPFAASRSHASMLSWAVVSSGLLEWMGALLYLSFLVNTLWRVGHTGIRPALLIVRPFLGMMVSGWFLYTSLNVLMLSHMALQQSVVVHAGWNRLAVDSFVGLVLLPVAFAFSVRTFPLYLRLGSPDWSIQGTACAYLGALLLQLLPLAPPLVSWAPSLASVLHSVGAVLKSAIILWFVWGLDLLTRRKTPWTAQRALHPAPDRRPTRPGLPDYGEFGRFEWLIYAAYAWLIAAACGELTSGITGLAGRPSWVETSVIRHLYLLGFITHLILGMAVRMLPGFMKKRRIASPRLVAATFWLGNTAMACRVLIFFIPLELGKMLPSLMTFARWALGLSGLLGLAGIACLAVNLWITAQKR